MTIILPEAKGRGLWTSLLAIGFMIGMLVHEMLMEALWRLPAAPASLALWTSVAEFGFCALIPTLIHCVYRGPDSSLESAKDPQAAAAPAPESFFSAAGVAALARSWAPFVALSALVFVGTTLSTQSARYVDYPVKVVFKASKLLPTMVSATFMGNTRSFSGHEYFAAVALVVGTASFSWGDEAQGKQHTAAVPDLAYGVICLLFSVLSDAVSPNIQQKMMIEGVNPNLLLSRTNIIGVLIALVLALVLGGGSEFYEYALQLPIVLACLAGVGTTLSFSVVCQVHLIKEAGSVVSVCVSTLRKSGTLLLSYVVFPGKEFGSMRALGLVLVAFGLVMAEWNTIYKALTGDDNAWATPPAIASKAAASGKAYAKVAPTGVGARTSSIDDDSSDEEKAPATAAGVLHNTMSELDRILDEEEEQQEPEPAAAVNVMQDTIAELDRLGIDEGSSSK